MDYVKLDPYQLDLDAFMGLQMLLFIAVVAFSILAIYFAVESKEKMSIRLVATGVLALLIAGGIFGIVHQSNFMHEKSKAVKEYNKQASAANLLDKYDLQEVNWDSVETTAGPKSTSGDGEILVKIRSGEKFIFKYRVDLETSEPFLEDMPFHGGSAPEKAVTADSLVK